MNVYDLERLLLEENFPQGSFNLEGEYLDGGYSLSQIGDRWRIEYSDRGLPCFVAEFSADADACEFFLMKMRELVPNRRGVGGRA